MIGALLFSDKQHAHLATPQAIARQKNIDVVGLYKLNFVTRRLKAPIK
jgi:hypothetical protein